MKRFPAVVSVFFVTLPLLAQISWLGGSGAYENASKWSTGFVPGSTNETIYPAGAYTITVDTVVTNARMRFENASVNAEIRVGPAGELVATNGLIVKSGTASKPNSVTISSGKVTLPGLVQNPLSGVTEGSYGTLIVSNATLNAAGAYWYVGRNSNETRNRMIVGPDATVTTPQIVQGDANTANFNEIAVQGQGASWTVNGQTRVGLTGRLNTLAVTNNGVFRTISLRVGANLGGNSNRVYIADGGYFELSGTGGDNNFHIGSNGAYNELLIASNGLVSILRNTDAGGGAGVGMYTASSNNTLTIEAGGILTNLISSFYVGRNNNAVSNALLIKGGSFVMPITNYSFSVGDSSEGNRVLISDNGLLDLAGDIRLGWNAGGRNNRIIVSNATVNTTTLTVGYFGTGNCFTLTSNAVTTISTTNLTSIVLGSDVNAKFNRLEVSDGASITGLRDLAIGYYGSENSLYVGSNANTTFGNLIAGMNASASSNRIDINGGTITATRANGTDYNSIGKYSAYNTATIRNGGMLNLSNRLYVGSAATACFNTLTISEGGILRCTDIIIGDNNNSNNEVVVTGAGSCLLSRGNSPTRVGAGSGSTGNKLSVLDGAFLDAGQSAIGVTYASTSTNNAMVISNATVYCTNNTLYAYNQGKITIQGSNSLIRCKGFTLYTDASLAFEIPREGIVGPALDVSSTVALSIDARLYVSAPEWFAKVGGRLPLVRSATTNDMAKFTTQAILDPAGLSLELSADSKTLYLVGPSRAATVMLVR